MKRYFVHVYHELRSVFAVEAEDQAGALLAAENLMMETRIKVDGLIPADYNATDLAAPGIGHLYSEDADEITSFFVEEVGDKDFANTKSYDQHFVETRRPGIILSEKDRLALLEVSELPDFIRRRIS